MKYLLLIVCLPFVIFSCQNESATTTNNADYGNPAADGFNAAQSDEKAVALADEVMEAMGGRKNWDDTPYLTWNFFGSRKHYWNKKTGDIRIESIKDSTTYLMNIHSMEGKVQVKGTELTEPDTLKKFLTTGKSMWINDAYWLVMPFKLKDSGVTLKYIGQDTSQTNAEVLELTFKNVGDTPDNKYLVSVDKSSKLVNQWAFYGNYDDPQPRFTMPWLDYEQKGKILLSGNRGRMKLTEVDAPETLDSALFREF